MIPSLDSLLDQIEKMRGNISAIARAYNKPRSTVYNWINSYPEAQQAISDNREYVVDTAESKLLTKVENGEDNSIFYVLNNMKEARTRGWGNRLDVTTGGSAVQGMTINVWREQVQDRHNQVADTMAMFEDEIQD